MDTPLEESNLAYIGSDEDKAAKHAAAALEVNWEGAGTEPGIQIWRVENARDEHGNPDFGINPWPTNHYGEFFTGDSYIILHTQQDDDDAGLVWDIYFWIGSESSQDEYGVAAYKANELDDLLGTAPVQHRETMGYESEDFLALFPHLKYLKGGVESGFQTVDDSTAEVAMPTRMFHIRKIRQDTRSYLTDATVASLNQGDAFVLDTGDVVYTWYGQDCSPFEKNKAAEVAHAMVASRYAHATLEVDVQDDNEAFWTALGGGSSADVQPATAVTDEDMPQEHDAKMYILKEEDSKLKVELVEGKPTRSQLDTEGVCMIDIGIQMFVWIGKGASKREQSQAMSMLQTYLKNWKREKNTQVIRVLEGQESRCKSFRKKALA